MAQQLITIGTTPGDNTGDPARTAFDKTNDNFTELYQAGPVTRWVNDLAALRTYPSTGLTEAQAAVVDGSTWRWFSLATAADDDALVVTPFDSPATGRWLRDYTTLSVRFFGAVGDGVTNDTAAIQAAIDATAAAGGGTVIAPVPPNYYSVAKLIAKSNVTFLVPNRDTTFISEQGLVWDMQKSWSFGNYHGNDYDAPPAYALNALTFGDTAVTLTTAANSAEFVEGDCVFIESTTGSAFAIPNSQYENMPAFFQMNVVTSSAGGVVGLRHPIHETRANAQMRRASRTGLNTSGGSTALEAVRDFKLLGGTWKTLGKSFSADGGIIDSEISPDVVVASVGNLYGNCWAHVTAKVGTLRTTGIPVALALGAHNTTLEIGTVQVSNINELTRLVEFAESCRDCTVKIGSAVAKGAIADIVDFVGARRNTCEIDSVRVASITESAIKFWSPEYTENYPGGAPTNANVEYLKANYNKARINSCYANSVSSGVATVETVLTSAKYNRGEVNFVDVEPTNYCGDTTANFNTVLVTSPSYYLLRGLGFHYSSYGVSLAAPLNLNVTIPAGTVRTSAASASGRERGDYAILRLRGTNTGTSGTRSLTITVAGTQVFAATLPNLSAQGIFVETRIAFVSNSVVTANTQAQLEGVGNVDDVGVTGLNFTTTDYAIQVAASCTGSDLINFRELSLTFYRNGAPL